MVIKKFSHYQVLNLAENDLSMVESSALAKTVVALEELDLTASSLTVAQVGCVIITIIIIIIVVIINIIVIIIFLQEVDLPPTSPSPDSFYYSSYYLTLAKWMNFWKQV